MLTGILAGLLAVWAMLSILAQFPRFQAIRNNRLHGGMIPNWYLFTTPLLQSDLELQVRSGDGAWTAAPVAPPKPWPTLVWNPNRRVQYAFLGMVESLVLLRLARRRNAAPLTPAFRILSGFAARRLKTSSEAQFRIASRDASAAAPRTAILFVSHPGQP